MDNLVVVDGDLIPYCVGFACQKSSYSIVDSNGKIIENGIKGKKAAIEALIDKPNGCIFQEDIHAEPLGIVLSTVNTMIARIIEGSKCDHYKVFLTGDTNYRDDIATLRKYKGHRDGTAKPIHWQSIRDHLIKAHGAVVAEGIEADDAVSIVQTKYRAKGARCVIATFDKDLNGTAGLHYNFQSGKDILYDVSEDEALYFFYKQVLTGDLATDNIQGIPGIGDKKADKILADVPINDKDLYQAILGAYTEYYEKHPEEYQHWDTDKYPEPIKPDAKTILIENARLIHMLKEPVKKGVVPLWNPPE